MSCRSPSSRLPRTGAASGAGRLASFGPAFATWDLSGRLVELSFDGITRHFDLLGGRIERDASTGSVGALDLGEISLAPLPAERTYRYYDMRGSVSFTTDSGGQVTNHYRYGAYAVDRVYGPGDNRDTFDGKLEIGPFMLLGARTYDPAIGRFLSVRHSARCFSANSETLDRSAFTLPSTRITESARSGGR